MSSGNPVSGIAFLSADIFKSTDYGLVTVGEKMETIKTKHQKKADYQHFMKQQESRPCLFFCSQQLAWRQSSKWKAWGQIRPSLALDALFFLYYFLFLFFFYLKRGSVCWSCGPLQRIELRGLLHIHDALFNLTERLIKLMWQGGARQCCKCHSAAIRQKKE